MVKIILNILVQVFNYIYDFLFDWEDDTYDEKDFIENEKAKHALSHETSKEQLTKNNSTVTVKQNKNALDFDLLKAAFGEQSAQYIFELREEVDQVVEKHGLVRENTFIMAIPPEKLRESLLTPDFFERTIERVYSQYDKDVIIKPGKINIKRINKESFYAEVQIEAYMVTEELLAQV